MLMSAVLLFDAFIVIIMHAPVICSGQTGVLRSPSSNNLTFLFHLLDSCVSIISSFSMNKSAVHLFDRSVLIIMHVSFNCSGQTDALHSLCSF